MDIQKPTQVYVSPEDRKVLQYIKDHINEDITFYPSMHSECPEGSKWATAAQLTRLQRKKLLSWGGGQFMLPCPIWITQAGLDYLAATDT